MGERHGRFRLNQGVAETDHSQPMETITVSKEGPALNVRLNRPAVRNAFDLKLMTEVREVCEGLDDDVRVVLLSAEGAVFSAGVDFHWMVDSAKLSEEENQRDAEALALMLRAVDECRCPVVARVHGHAVAGGAALVACCDAVVTAPEARFGFTEVRLGVDPAVIFPFVVPKIGLSQARRYILTGELFDAAEAQRMGLVHEVTSTETLDKRVDAIVKEVLQGGPVAAASAKKSLRELPSLDREEAHRRTVAKLADMRVSAEGREGLNAFLERREPRF
jgi:methylglutaconyl-CoA hydratase